MSLFPLLEFDISNWRGMQRRLPGVDENVSKVKVGVYPERPQTAWMESNTKYEVSLKETFLPFKFFVR